MNILKFLLIHLVTQISRRVFVTGYPLPQIYNDFPMIDDHIDYEMSPDGKSIDYKSPDFPMIQEFQQDGYEPEVVYGWIDSRKNHQMQLQGSFHPWEKGGEFEGDIVIHPSFRAGFSNPRWFEALIPYEFQGSFDDDFYDEFNEAINNIESLTCIRFKEREFETNYLRISSEHSGCSSYIGMIGGEQRMNLSEGCWYKDTIVHEMVHAIGFLHEQSRKDRDMYVNIIWGNIEEGDVKKNFRIWETIDFNTPYDFYSIMHYSATAFSKDDESYTITAKVDIDPELFGIGWNKGLTKSDALQINRMYNCW